MKTLPFSLLMAAVLSAGLTLTACEGSAPGSEAGSGKESGGSVMSADNETLNADTSGTMTADTTTAPMSTE